MLCYVDDFFVPLFRCLILDVCNMPVYEYKALDGHGRSRKGIIDADSESGARTRIRALGHYPVEVRESSARKRQSGDRVLCRRLGFSTGEDR